MAVPDSIARRTFFAGLGLVSIVGLAPKIFPKTNASYVPVEPQSASDSYRLTEHISKYYRSATI
jgi:hypothetical protein